MSIMGGLIDKELLVVDEATWASQSATQHSLVPETQLKNNPRDAAREI